MLLKIKDMDLTSHEKKKSRERDLFQAAVTHVIHFPIPQHISILEIISFFFKNLFIRHNSTFIVHVNITLPLIFMHGLNWVIAFITLC